jgi:hypothetical protein
MLKKSLIFGSVALFLAALITLTGCPTSTNDGGSSTMAYAHRIYGRNVDPYQAQEAIDRAVAAGEPIVLEDRLTIDAAFSTLGGHLNFKTAQVVVNGYVTFNNGVMSMAEATVTWRDGSFIDMGGQGRYIHRRYDDTTKVTPSALVEFANSLDEIMPTATHAAVKRFQLGPLQNYDYSTSSNGIDARINDPVLQVLYVLDELVIPTEGTYPGNGPQVPNPGELTITAMGDVNVTGAPPSSVVIGNQLLPLGTCSTLTSSKGGIVIPLPAAVAPDPTVIPNVAVKAGRDFGIARSGVPGGLLIEGKLTGEGVLEVVSPVASSIAISGGNGNIRFSGATNGTINIGIASTGEVSFDNAVTISDDESVIASNVVFRNDVTVDNDAGAPVDYSLGLYGNVTLVSPASLTLNSTAPLILGGDKTISLAITPTPTGSPTTLAAILKAGPSDVTITPAVPGATLTPANRPTKNDETAIAAAKKISLADQNVEITDGTLQVVSGAIFDVKGVVLSTATNAGAGEIGYLAVADGGTLTLTLDNAVSGSISIIDTVIGNVSTLKASGGTITLGNNVIAGSAPGAKLTPEKGSAGTTITVNGATDDRLTLQQAELNLAAYGSLVLVPNGRVILNDGAKLTLNSGENGIPTTLSSGIATTGGNARLAGDFDGLTAPGSTTKQAVWSVAHKGGTAQAASIIADANISISKSGATFR